MLHKDSTLQNKLVDIAADTTSISEDFKKLEVASRQYTKSKTEEASKEVNAAHNRYNDICKFSSLSFYQIRTAYL